MDKDEHGVARRAVLMSAGVGIGAGLISGLAPAHAQGAAAAGAEIWSQEYWADKGGVKLNLWRKRAGAPKPGDKPLPILFLVHGSSNSDAFILRSQRAGQGRILADERHGARRL
jgi:hypothetical protein